jgi:hypothetical protein
MSPKPKKILSKSFQGKANNGSDSKNLEEVQSQTSR